MSEVIAYGIEFNRALEGYRTPLLTIMFKIFTFLGSTKGYFLVIPVIYWIFSRSLGLRLLYGIMLCNLVNTILKELIQLPRPFLLGNLNPLDQPQSYSFPSGHAQIAAFFAVFLIVKYRTKTILGLGLAFALLTGFSRAYLGAHFFFDVLAGWALGIVLALYYSRYDEALLRYTPSFLITFGFLLFFCAVPIFFTDFLTLSTAGGLAGTLIASRLDRQRLAEQLNLLRSWRKRILLCLCGFSIFFLMFYSARLNIENKPIVFLHNLLMAFWIVYAVPKLGTLCFARHEEVSAPPK